MKTFETNEERFAALEQSNRRLKAGMMVVGGMATMVAILGAAAPVPQTLEANKFVLRDVSGTKRAELAMDENIAVMRMFNLNGTVALELASAQTGNGLWIKNEQGTPRETLVVGQSNAMFGFTNGKTISARIEDTDDVTDFTVYDKAGHSRVAVGFASKVGPSVGMFDEAGQVRTLIEQGWAATTNEDGTSNWSTKR